MWLGVILLRTKITEGKEHFLKEFKIFISLWNIIWQQQGILPLGLNEKKTILKIWNLKNNGYWW